MDKNLYFFIVLSIKDIVEQVHHHWLESLCSTIFLVSNLGFGLDEDLHITIIQVRKSEKSISCSIFDIKFGGNRFLFHSTIF